MPCSLLPCHYGYFVNLHMQHKNQPTVVGNPDDVAICISTTLRLLRKHFPLA